MVVSNRSPAWACVPALMVREVEVGADRFMRDLGVDITLFAALAAELGTQGESPLYAAIDGRLAAIIAVSVDQAERAGAIAALING